MTAEREQTIGLGAAPALGRRRFAGLALASLVVVLLLAIIGARGLFASSSRGSTPGFNGGSLSPTQPIGDLSLRQIDGQVWTSAATHGRLSLFLFGYTFCPDVCPLTLNQLAQVKHSLGEQADALDIYFVTVDPARDTPERLSVYTEHFDGDIVALTGSDDELARARDAFGVVAEHRDIPGSEHYAMDHTASTFLVDRDGSIRLIYPFGSTADEIAVDLTRLLRERPAA